MQMRPSALNCPNCGASVASLDATRCDYCTSALTSVACPACFGGIFAGMKFCPHCGAKGDRAVQDAAAPVSCPDCRSPMHHVNVGAASFMECNECASVWIEADEFTRMCTDREQRGAIAAMVGTSRSIEAPRKNGVRYLSCPVCKRTMNRQNFGRRSGVIIDVCKGHGVWFEEGELQRVMSFIDRGGLEQARSAESERQREEQRRLLAELNKLLA